MKEMTIVTKTGVIFPQSTVDTMMDSGRRWDTESQQWVHVVDVSEALDAATLAIYEYYNGDREWAERWLLRAYEANRKENAK